MSLIKYNIKLLSNSGEPGQQPRLCTFQVNDSAEDVVAAGFMNTILESTAGETLYTNDFIFLTYGNVDAPEHAIFNVTVDDGVFTLVPTVPHGTGIYDPQYLMGARNTYVDDEKYEIDVVKCTDSTNTFKIEAQGFETQDLTVSGVNGIDTGAVEASKTYYTHIIADSAVKDAKPVAAIASLSATSPTLPTGYDKFRCTGFLRTGATAEILPFTCKGEGIDKIYQFSASETLKFLTNGTQTSETTVEMGEYLPVQVKKVGLVANLSATSGTEPLGYIGLPGVAIADNGEVAALTGGGTVLVSGVTSTYGGGGTSHEFDATGLKKDEKPLVSIYNQTNDTYLLDYTVNADDKLTAQFKADPGAGTVLSYLQRRTTGTVSHLENLVVAPALGETTHAAITYKVETGGTLNLGVSWVDACFAAAPSE